MYSNTISSGPSWLGPFRWICRGTTALGPFIFAIRTHRATAKRKKADDVKAFLAILEEKYVDVAEVSDALAASNRAELVELAKQIRSKIASSQKG